MQWKPAVEMIVVLKNVRWRHLEERFQHIIGCCFGITHVSFPPRNCHFSNSPFWKLQYAKLWQQFRKLKSLPTVCDICLKIIHLAQSWPLLKWVRQWNVCLGSLHKGRKSRQGGHLIARLWKVFIWLFIFEWIFSSSVSCRVFLLWLEFLVPLPAIYLIPSSLSFFLLYFGLVVSTLYQVESFLLKMAENSTQRDLSNKGYLLTHLPNR